MVSRCPGHYCPTAVTAGGIYLSLPQADLADGTVWNTWEDNDGIWRDGGADVNGTPVQVSPAAFAPAGALLQVAMQNSEQLNVFAVGVNGAIWTTWESGDGVWQNGRNDSAPSMITPPNYALPGKGFGRGLQGDDQLDVFFVGYDGAVWVTWERGDTPWTDGLYGRPGPARLTGPGIAPPGANLACAKLNDNELNVFVVDTWGAIRCLSVIGYGEWQEFAVTGPDQFPPGAPLVATKPDDDRLNVFVVNNAGAITMIWRTSDLAWQMPLAVSPQNFAVSGAFLAAALQDSSQLDVFVVGNDGAMWVTWGGIGDVWTDGLEGGSPQPITGPNLSIPGAPLAADRQGDDQLDVFVAGLNDAIWVTSEKGDSAWTDGLEGRQPPVPVTPWGYAPRGGGVAAIARNKTHVDAFAVGAGRIQSFLQLPNLLAEAKSLGTNIVYLTDYWEGADQGGDPPWWNKGDYKPRSDLGGEAAFSEGISAIQQQGGRVLLYLEPFIIYKFSNIGKEKGFEWAGLDKSGSELPDYPRNYSMVAPFVTWQDYVAETAVRLVQQYRADGIFLDSYGWQMNRPMINGSENNEYSAEDYSLGVLSLTKKVRDAIQNVKPDAVVLGETTVGPIARYWDGGLSADLGFADVLGKDESGNWIEKLIASPVRYGIPEVRIFTNGWDLKGLNQVYAAGHGLALSSFWHGSFMHDNAAYIKTLVEIRASYKDALIHGAQTYQPKTDSSSVIAYHYEGAIHSLMAMVNMGNSPVDTDVTIKEPNSGWIWKDLISGDLLETEGGILKKVHIGEGGLRILLRLRFPSIGLDS